MHRVSGSPDVSFDVGVNSLVRSFDLDVEVDPGHSSIGSDLSFSTSPTGSSASRGPLTSSTPGFYSRVTRLGEPHDSSTAKTLTVYNQYGPKSARQYDLTEAQETTLQRHYQDLKRSLLPPGASDFAVNFTMQTASYREADGTKVTVSIDGDSPAFRQASALIRKEVYGGHFQRSYFKNAADKGSHNGPKALVRPERPHLVELPTYLPPSPENQDRRDRMKNYAIGLAIKLSGPEKQAVVEKRIGDAQQKLDGMHLIAKKRIEEIEINLEKPEVKDLRLRLVNRIDILEGPLMQPSLSDAEKEELTKLKTQLDELEKQIKDLEKQLQEEKEKLKEIEKIDVYALYTALALYPDQNKNDPEQVRAAADKLCKIILDDTSERINASRFANVPLIGLFFGEGELKEYKGYAADVAGLLFAGLGVAGREPYAHYCNAQRIPMKGQTEEDVLFHDVING